MSMFAKERLLFHRDHLSISEIQLGRVCRRTPSKPG